jgi:DNA-binding GntR family transcriptional regulator
LWAASAPVCAFPITAHAASRILFELRFSVEKIIFQRVMREGRGSSALPAELEEIVSDMAELSASDDPLVLSSIDLDLHRAIAHHSGNELAAQIWEELAQHLVIVFCGDWSDAEDRPGEVWLHLQLLDYLEHGSVDDIDTVLATHFSGPARRKSGHHSRGNP